MERDFLRKFLKGSASTSAGSMVTVVFHFFSIMILTRSMPKEAFGIYAMVMVIAHGLQVLSSLGLDLTLVKFLSGDYKDKKREVFTAVMAYRGGMLVAMSALLFGAGHYLLPFVFDGAVTPFLLFIPAVFCLGSLRELFFKLLQAQGKFGRFAQIQILSALVRLSTIGVFYVKGWLTVEYILWVEIVTYGFSFLLLFVAGHAVKLFTFTVTRNTWKEVRSFSGPLYSNDILTYIHNRVDVLLLGAMLTPVSVAYFDVASKVPDGFRRLFQSLIVVYFPSMSGLWNEGKKEAVQEFMSQALVIVASILAMVTMTAYLFREELVVLLFSEQYREASLPFALMVMAFLIGALGRLMGYTIVSAGHVTVPVRINAVASVVNIVGCLIMIPRIGLLGAIFAMLGMQVVGHMLNVFFLYRVGLKPQLASYLRPIGILLFLLGLYSVLDYEAVGVKVLFLATQGYITYLLIPQVREACTFTFSYLRRRLPRPS